MLSSTLVMNMISAGQITATGAQVYFCGAERVDKPTDIMFITNVGTYKTSENITEPH
jgi:hypothetical protein